MTMPPSTIDELGPVLVDYDSTRPRSLQQNLGPSELGAACAQQLARKLAGAPRKAPTQPLWAPFQGMAVHSKMEEVVDFWNQRLGRRRWMAETDLDIGDGITGRADAYDGDHAMVVDWKLTGTSVIDQYLTKRRKGLPVSEQIKTAYRVQAHVYGYGHVRAGREDRWVRLVMLPRHARYTMGAERKGESTPGGA